jgi:hypothetical protein
MAESKTIRQGIPCRRSLAASLIGRRPKIVCPSWLNFNNCEHLNKIFRQKQGFFRQQQILKWWQRFGASPCHNKCAKNLATFLKFHCLFK